jgi:hypothetical protein
MCKYEKTFSANVLKSHQPFNSLRMDAKQLDQEFARKITFEKVREILVHSFAAIDLSFKIQSYRDQDIDNLSLLPVVLLAVLVTVDQVLNPHPDHAPQRQSLQCFCKGTAMSSKH